MIATFGYLDLQGVGENKICLAVPSSKVQRCDHSLSASLRSVSKHSELNQCGLLTTLVILYINGHLLRNSFVLYP